MNRNIRRVGVALLLLYLVLFVQLNRVTLLEADEYAASPLNRRAIERDFSQPRGVIQTRDGVVVAESVPSEGRFERVRRYPHGPLYSHLTGYFSFAFGTDGLERSYNAQLAGRDVEVAVRNLGDLFIDRRPTADLTLTIDHALQQVAAAALGERKGSVVVLDPRDGAVLAMYSWPTFDPNALSVHDLDAAEAARQALQDDPNRPLLPRTYRERFFPGSTFKIVTAAAGLERGEVTPTQPVYPVTNALQLPTTNRPLRNFGGSSCGGNLLRIIQVSCNTAFGQMALDLGAEPLWAEATDWGFNERPPLDLPAVAASVFPGPEAFERDIPALAQSAIGQRDVQATPLQMALVAAGVATGGRIMVPHVMAEVTDSEGNVIERWEPQEWKVPIDPTTAEVLRQGMIAVVDGGTGTRAAVPGVQVAAKTGTAELGADSDETHAWMIAFAPAEAPRIAIAVIVEGGGGRGSETGGRVAAPVVQQVLAAALAQPDTAQGQG